DVQVSVVEARDSILDFVDRGIIADFMHQLCDRGMRFRLGSRLDSITVADGQPVAVLADGGQIRSDILLY
ncbi:NAD-binding protein, partial [Komagataeibacter intermedius]